LWCKDSARREKNQIIFEFSAAYLLAENSKIVQGERKTSFLFILEDSENSEYSENSDYSEYSDFLDYSDCPDSWCYLTIADYQLQI
jgi:hypothetical protein